MHRNLLRLSVAAVALFPATAFAQTQSDTTATSNDAQIVVTAQGRQQELQNVPIAISAISADTLQRSGASDIRQLNQVSPSLLVSGASSESQFSARIRGIGTVGENIGLEASVGLMIDGVYRARTGVGLSELGEIERIEVLRGPQGTLFGRNSTAGLINVITKGPQFTFGGNAAASYGNYDAWRLEGGVTGPVSDTLAVRLDGVWQKRDGFLRNMTPGEPNSYDRDRWMLRGQILFQPTADISLRLIGDYSKRDEHCCASVYVGPVRDLARLPSGEIVTRPNSLVPLLQALGANLQLPGPGEQFVRRFASSPGTQIITNMKDWGVSGELNWDFGGTKLTAITAYRDNFTRQGIDADYMSLDVAHRDASDRTIRQFTQEMRLQGKAFNDRLDWLIGGYYGTESIRTVDTMTYGKDFDRFANCLVAGAGANPASPTCGSPAPLSVLYPTFGVPSLIGAGANGSSFDAKSRNYAFFTHNVISLVPDKLQLTLGLRYTNERKEVTSNFLHNNLLCPILQQRNSALAGIACIVDYRRPSITSADPGSKIADDRLTGTAVLSFKPIDDLMIYGSYSKGYKAGGFNLDSASLDPLCGTTVGSAAAIAACQTRLALPANQPGNGRAEAIDMQFAAETVDTYEIGFKYNGKGIGLNVAAFYSRFRDFQLNTFNGLTFEVTNIMSCRDNLNGADRNNNPFDGACAANRLKPGVTSKGFEAEVFLRPARDLNVNMGLTYADSRYENNLVGTGGRPLPIGLFLLPGQTMSNAPRYVVTSGISYTPKLGDSGMSALFYLNARMQSDINTGSNLDVEKIQDGYLLLNGRIGIYGPEKRWGIEFWGQNLLNKQYLQVIAGAPAQGSGSYGALAAGFATSANQLFMGFPGEPRTYGATVRVKF